MGRRLPPALQVGVGPDPNDEGRMPDGSSAARHGVFAVPAFRVVGVGANASDAQISSFTSCNRPTKLGGHRGSILSLGHQTKASAEKCRRQAAAAAKVSPMRTFAAMSDSRVISAVASASLAAAASMMRAWNSQRLRSAWSCAR